MGRRPGTSGRLEGGVSRHDGTRRGSGWEPPRDRTSQTVPTGRREGCVPSSTVTGRQVDGSPEPSCLGGTGRSGRDRGTVGACPTGAVQGPHLTGDSPSGGHAPQGESSQVHSGSRTVVSDPSAPANHPRVRTRVDCPRSGRRGVPTNSCLAGSPRGRPSRPSCPLAGDPRHPGSDVPPAGTPVDQLARDLVPHHPHGPTRPRSGARRGRQEPRAHPRDPSQDNGRSGSAEQA